MASRSARTGCPRAVSTDGRATWPERQDAHGGRAAGSLCPQRRPPRGRRSPEHAFSKPVAAWEFPVPPTRPLTQARRAIPASRRPKTRRLEREHGRSARRTACRGPRGTRQAPTRGCVVSRLPAPPMGQSPHPSPRRANPLPACRTWRVHRTLGQGFGLTDESHVWLPSNISRQSGFPPSPTMAAIEEDRHTLEASLVGETAGRSESRGKSRTAFWLPP